MQEQEFDYSQMFTSEELAVHIVDTLIDHGFIEKSRLNDAVASAKWELDAQYSLRRIILKPDTKRETQ